MGVPALHPRTYSVIDEEILAQEAESLQEDARGINLKIFNVNKWLRLSKNPWRQNLPEFFCISFRILSRLEVSFIYKNHVIL